MNKLLFFLFGLILFCASNKIQAQDLEPRFLSSMPLKANFAGLAYNYSFGDILLNAQQIENLNARLNTVAAYYGHSFKLFNKLAKVDALVPYSSGTFNALVEKIDTTAYRNGLNDPTIKLSIILIGEQPLNPHEFAKRERKKFKMGAAFKVKPPLGQYDDSKIINLGANRWGFQFKAASSYQFSKKIVIEVQIDSWFFTENTSYYNGNTLAQKPLLSAQLHMAYIFNPRLWVSGSIGQVAIGETSINGIEQDNNQDSSKFGLTASYKLKKTGSIKLIATKGLYTSLGTNFRTILIGYSFLWFDKNNK